MYEPTLYIPLLNNTRAHEQRKLILFFQHKRYSMYTELILKMISIVCTFFLVLLKYFAKLFSLVYFSRFALPGLPPHRPWQRQLAQSPSARPAFVQRACWLVAVLASRRHAVDLAPFLCKITRKQSKSLYKWWELAAAKTCKRNDFVLSSAWDRSSMCAARAELYFNLTST